MSEKVIDPALNPDGSEVQDSERIERFLTFNSDNIVFGISTNNVIEIITSYMICTLPMVPEYIKGIINLRGNVIPVIDIRLRMGKMPCDDEDSTCIIILSINDTEIGIIVDSVRQVLDIDKENISPIPVQNRQVLTSSMTSLEDGTVVLFLDCEELLRQ